MNGWRTLREKRASFLACIEESISERVGKQFEKGLNIKVKLDKV